MSKPAIEGDPRPAWDVIEIICAARFTGQVSLSTAVGTTHVYMTRGLIYFAEHTDEVSIGDRALAAGAIPAELLPNDDSILHAVTDLDELFADQPNRAREGVEELIEVETERTLLEISELPVLALDSMMYRHHSSGIDRWFSSQHARGAETARPCESKVVTTEGEPIPVIPPPELIPPLAREVPTADVSDAVRRAVSAIDAATRKLGAAPKGFVRRPPRGPAATH